MAILHGVQLFRDTDGNVAQLHGIGVQRFGDRWYAYGEIKHNGNLFQGVACYTTTDFATWRNEGTVLSVGDEDSITGPKRIIERPKVMRRPSDGKYVMYLHVDGEGNYGYAHIGTAISDSPTGPFEFLSTFQFRGYESRDIGVFQDEDGTGYILSEDRSHGTHIYRLSEDYLSVVEDVACLRGTNYRFGYESPIMVKRDGIYYWFGSQLTGWDCNDNMYATATDLHGPWSDWQPFTPEGSHTFDSQCDIIVPLDGAAGNTATSSGDTADATAGRDDYHATRFLYIGDRWNNKDLGNSELVTLPIEIGDRKALLEWHDEWDNQL